MRVLRDDEIARFHAEWRREACAELTTAIEQARCAKPEKRQRMGARVVAWTMMTIAHELAIHGRKGGAPDIETSAELISQLAFGPGARVGRCARAGSRKYERPARG